MKPLWPERIGARGSRGCAAGLQVGQERMELREFFDEKPRNQVASSYGLLEALNGLIVFSSFEVSL